MSERDSNREYRRKRRRRSQLISYSVTAVVLIAVIAGCAVGIRAAAGTIRERRQAKEASIQAAAESVMEKESAEAQSAVEELLGMESTQEESTVEYTPEDALNEMVEESVAGMTLEQKVAGLFFVTPEQLTGVGQAVQAGEGTQEALAKWPVGGLVYFKQNIQSEEQLKLGLENVGPMADIGSAGDVQAAYAANQTIGTYLSSYGFNVDFAPIADVLTNPDNTVIGDRAFSDDPQTAADMVAGAVEGLQSAGVSACLKHFPGHGDTAGDSHTGAAETDRTKEEMAAAEFLPFQSGIEAGADMVMVGHISAPNLTGGEKVPASLSEEIITGILRSELGYDGIIITDAMNMAAVIL